MQELSRFVVVALGLASYGCEEVLGAQFNDASLERCQTPGKACGADGLGTCLPSGACEGPKTKLAAMFRHTCALMHDGRVWCWGQNTFGEVGDGTTDFRPNPVEVLGVPLAVDLAAGEGHSCVITVDNEVWCWGNDLAGQSSGEQSDDPGAILPTRVKGLEGIEVKAITAGRAHTCVVSAQDGAVHCWGLNDQHQCGPSTEIAVPPTRIPNLDLVVELASVKAHNCAWRGAAPNLVCWGRNAEQQLGPLASGMPSSGEPVPVELPNGLAAAGVGLTYETSYAIGSDGHVYSWGYNLHEQAGVGSDETHIATPTEVIWRGIDDVAEPLSSVARLSRVDATFQCAEVLNTPRYGARYVCWGKDDAGELGRGVLEQPGITFGEGQPAVAIPLEAHGITHGEDHGCAVVPAGERDQIWCWGTAGLVGDGRAPPSPGAPAGPPQLVPAPVQWLE